MDDIDKYDKFNIGNYLSFIPLGYFYNYEEISPHLSPDPRKNIIQTFLRWSKFSVSSREEKEYIRFIAGRCK